MKRIKTFLEYLTALAIIVLLLFTIASVVVIKFYGDEVESYAMDFVNNQLETDIKIDEIGITIFRKFPNTSIYLSNVSKKSGEEYLHQQFDTNFRDTLLKADYIYLKFNIINLIRRDFQINSLELSGTTINILIDDKGKGNYIFGKDTVNENNELFVDVKKLKLDNTKIRYINHAKQTNGKIYLSTIDLNGNFSKDKLNLNTSLEGIIENFDNYQINYISKTAISADIGINVDQKKYNISTGKINLGDLQASLEGSLDYNEGDKADLDLKFEGRQVDIAWIEDILSLREKFKNKIHSEGLLNVKGSIKGIASPTESPSIAVTFSTNRAKVEIESETPYKLQEISFRGSYTNGSQSSMRSSSVIIDHFETKVLHSDINGSFIITNFLQPQFRFSLRGNLNAEDWIALIPKQPLQIKKGMVYPNLIIEGNIDGLKSDDRKISFTPTGDLKVENMAIQLNQNSNPLEISINSGNIDMQPKRWNLNMNGLIESIDFESDITMLHPLQQFQKKDFIQLSGNLSSNRIDIEEAIKIFRPKKKSAELKYPEKIMLDFDIQVDTITHKNITANNLKGSFSYRFPSLTISPFDLKTMNGFTNGSIHLAQINKTSQKLEIEAAYENLDIHNLFISMDEFGQDFITSQNIAGRLSGETDFSATISKGSRVKGSDIIAESNVSISNGELINFMPVMKMYDFLDIPNPEHIKFSEISNTLIINDNKLVIPEMQINSSAINLSASGTHGFNGIFDYHLAIRLSDYLYKRSRISKDSEFEIAIDEEDTRTVFLVLQDEGDGTKISFDEEQAMKKVRQDLKEEKQELKEILREEFRSEESKTNDQTIIKEQGEPMMRFKFPDQTEEDTIKQKEAPRKKWWRKEDTNNRSPEFQFIIEESN